MKKTLSIIVLGLLAILMLGSCLSFGAHDRPDREAEARQAAQLDPRGIKTVEDLRQLTDLHGGAQAVFGEACEGGVEYTAYITLDTELAFVVSRVEGRQFTLIHVKNPPAALIFKLPADHIGLMEAMREFDDSPFLSASICTVLNHAVQVVLGKVI